VSQSEGGKIVFRFHARDLHMVLGPSEEHKSIRYFVRLDSAPPDENHGVDSDPDGSGEIRGPRLYQLIRQIFVYFWLNAALNRGAPTSSIQARVKNKGLEGSINLSGSRLI
jgi:Thioredoxin like C-terminal domain